MPATGEGQPSAEEPAEEAQDALSEADGSIGEEQSSAPAAGPPAPAPEPNGGGDEKTCKIPADHYLTHLPKHPKCDACQIAKMQFRPYRRSDPDKQLPAQFGGQITLDHVVTLHPEAVCFEGMADAVVVKDRATGWIEIFPIASKSTESTTGALRGFFCPRRDPQGSFGGRIGRNYRSM